MEQSNYENYPLWIVLISNFFSLAVYLLGTFVMYQLGLAWLVAYLAYVACLEFRLLKGSCVNCYYYGRTCAFGKGRLSCLLFKKGDARKFACRQITWKDILPDFLVSLVPMAAGVILLVHEFSWLVLGAILLLAVLSFAGSAFVRGSLACKYCKQRELGCPAERLFGKTKK
ncbi:Uncharacterised protein [Candidatus Burarchaeum australiense]|nr:Uncharacterised protein [Candidatus Burarchaeum australiense]